MKSAQNGSQVQYFGLWAQTAAVDQPSGKSWHWMLSCFLA